MGWQKLHRSLSLYRSFTRNPKHSLFHNTFLLPPPLPPILTTFADPLSTLSTVAVHCSRPPVTQSLTLGPQTVFTLDLLVLAIDFVLSEYTVNDLLPSPTLRLQKVFRLPSDLIVSTSSMVWPASLQGESARRSARRVSWAPGWREGAVTEITKATGSVSHHRMHMIESLAAVHVEITAALHARLPPTWVSHWWWWTQVVGQLKGILLFITKTTQHMLMPKYLPSTRHKLSDNCTSQSCWTQLLICPAARGFRYKGIWIWDRWH